MERDVDAIWQQLKSQHNVKATRFTSSDSISRKKASSNRQPGVTQQTGRDSSPPSNQAGAGDVLDGASIQRLAQALQSLDGAVVRAALHEVKAIMEAPQAPCLLESKLGKGLLRCFDNCSEACREMAVGSFIKGLQAQADNTLALLPYALPVLEERLALDDAHNPAEPSEEVRLVLMQLLSLILDQAGPAIAAYATEVWFIISASLSDSFHEVAMQGCRCAQQLAGTLGRRLGSTSKELVAAILPLATHKRHRVRIMAVEAIRDVVPQGAHEMILEMVAWRDPNMIPISAFYGDDIKINFCGKLATDDNVQVRLAFLDMIGNWMLMLPERGDHEARLMPYVLNGLCDEAPAVMNAALQLLDQLGQQYEREHEKELAEWVRFADQVENQAEARIVQLIQAGVVQYAAVRDAAEPGTGPDRHQVAEATVTHMVISVGGSDSSITESMAALAGVAAPFRLPGPFYQRPCLGSRLLARGNFNCLLPALRRELTSWQTGPRAMSAKLLLVNLLLVESFAERHLHVILPALCSAVHDTDAGPVVVECAVVLGCFCCFERLLDWLAVRLQDCTGEPQQQAGVLLVLDALLRGAGPTGCTPDDLQKLLKLLRSSGLVESHDRGIRAAVLDVVRRIPCAQLLQPLLATQSAHAAAASALAGPGVAATSEREAEAAHSDRHTTASWQAAAANDDGPSKCDDDIASSGGRASYASSSDASSSGSTDVTSCEAACPKQQWTSASKRQAEYLVAATQELLQLLQPSYCSCAGACGGGCAHAAAAQNYVVS